MRVISKKISYDDLISRVPGVIPSIVDSWTVPYVNSCNNAEEKAYYSYDSAVVAASQYNINSSELKHNTEFMNFDINNLREFVSGNYGLIPSDIIIPSNIANKVTDYTDIYVNIPDGNGGFYDLSWPKQDSDPHYEGRKIISGGTEIKIITYHTLIKWYEFFKEYYDLIESPKYERTYDSALDYYDKEIRVKNDELYAYYENLDLVFASRGGKDMYEWICNNCIIQFNIPEEYVEKWHITSMYFTDALKWYWWFSERVDLYSEITTLEDCKGADDCCDCQKYLELGGKGFYDAISKWITDNANFSPTPTNSASVTIPITFTTSIDDLGEMSIFSNEWEAGTDYHNTLISNEKIDGVTGGTIINLPYIIDEYGDVTYINEAKIIKDGSDKKGYEYSEKYLDISYKEDDWVDYTDKYIDDNPSLFASNGVVENGQLEAVTSYTYSPVNGKIIYNPTAIKSKIKYNKIDTVSINGNSYDVIDGEYVVMCYDNPSVANVAYKNGTKLQVFKDGGLKYVIINGKRKYVETDSHGVEKIYLFKCYDESDSGCPLSSGTYIIYDNVLYLTENRTINIGEIDNDIKYQYPLLDGYFDIDNNRFYVSGTSVVVSNGYIYDDTNDTYIYEFRELNDDELISFGIKSFTVDSNTSTVEISHLFDEIDCTVVAGFCDSKLDLLRRKEISTDDLGIELPGYFKSIIDVNDSGGTQSKYNNAYNECTLDILYKVGEVASLTDNNDLSDETYDYYNGDIITDITFYYKDKYGERKYIHQALNDNALMAISASTEEYENGGVDDDVLNKMYCDITYHLNAVLKIRKQTEDIPNAYSLADEYHSGVKYIDTVSVEESVGDYYLGNGSKFTYKYYSLNQEPSSIYLSDFNDNVTTDAATYFEIKPLLYILKNDKIEKVDNETYLSGWSKNNNVLVTPLTRSEFNMASSYPQNVDANIYIDRGINAAFEKHLKLQEIRTMEALETYSNGIFKFNNY